MPLMLVLLPAVAGAQDDGSLAREKSLWFTSGNAAGLGAAPFLVYNTADLGYRYSGGSFHLRQEGSGTGTLGFNTQGATKVGDIQLWGQFSYDNITEEGTRFNTVLYDPFDERMVYGVADPVTSQWKRQAYDMEFKLSAPVGSHLFAGLHVRYCDRIAAKQNDPRSESTRYDISVSPSVVLKLGKSALGMDLCYSHLLERSAPTLSNGAISQKVYLLRGLGNFTEDIVGAGGIRTMYYTGNSVGGHLQYGLDSEIDLLVDGGAVFHTTGLRQDAVQPRDMGRTQMLEATLGARMLVPKGRILHKLNLDLLFRSTDGIEYATKEITGSGWEIVSESVMSNYSTLSAEFKYDCFVTEGDSFLWDFSGFAAFLSKDDRYVSPESRFSHSGLVLGAGVCRRFLFRRSSLSTGLDLEAFKSLGGEYVYQGLRADSIPVQEWYPSDLKVLTADYVKAAASVEWLRGLDSGMSAGLKLHGGYLASDQAGSRFYAGAGLALVF